MKLKRGTIRRDGVIFWGYRSGQECWVLPEMYAVKLEKHRAANAAWYKANHVRNRAASAAWKKSNPERVQAANAAWYMANPEKKRALSSAWRTANPERHKASYAAWAKANPEKKNLIEARYRAIKLAAVPSDANVPFVAEFYTIAARVSKCLGIPHEVDHIVPLSMGGSHCHRNLQVIPATWNRRKHARFDYPLPDCYRTDGWMIV